MSVLPARRYHRVTPDQHRVLVDRVAAGVSRRAAAAEVGCHVATAHLHTRGIRRPPAPEVAALRERRLAMLAHGATIRAIARAEGVTPPAVLKSLRRAGATGPAEGRRP